MGGTNGKKQRIQKNIQINWRQRSKTRLQMKAIFIDAGSESSNTSKIKTFQIKKKKKRFY